MTAAELINMLRLLPSDSPINVAHPDAELCSDLRLLEVFVYPEDGEPFDPTKAAKAIAIGCGHIAEAEVGETDA